jgi:hypothetical protein
MSTSGLQNLVFFSFWIQSLARPLGPKLEASSIKPRINPKLQNLKLKKGIPFLWVQQRISLLHFKVTYTHYITTFKVKEAKAKALSCLYLYE